MRTNMASGPCPSCLRLALNTESTYPLVYFNDFYFYKLKSRKELAFLLLNKSQIIIFRLRG